LERYVPAFCQKPTASHHAERTYRQVVFASDGDSISHNLRTAERKVIYDQWSNNTFYLGWLVSSLKVHFWEIYRDIIMIDVKKRKVTSLA
jgi:hypothetical protein